jgi:hypothetical protein
VEDNILTPLLWVAEVFLDPTKGGTVGHSVRPHVAVKDPSVLLHRVEDNVSAHLLVGTEVFPDPTKGGTVVTVLALEVPAFKRWVSFRNPKPPSLFSHED